MPNSSNVKNAIQSTIKGASIGAGVGLMPLIITGAIGDVLFKNNYSIGLAVMAGEIIVPAVIGATYGAFYSACKTPTAAIADEESPLIAADNIAKDTSGGFRERISYGATSCFSYFFSRSEKTSVITEQTVINTDADNPFTKKKSETFSL